MKTQRLLPLLAALALAPAAAQATDRCGPGASYRFHGQTHLIQAIGQIHLALYRPHLRFAAAQRAADELRHAAHELCRPAARRLAHLALAELDHFCHDGSPGHLRAAEHAIRRAIEIEASYHFGAAHFPPAGAPYAGPARGFGAHTVAPPQSTQSPFWETQPLWASPRYARSPWNRHSGSHAGWPSSR